ncbi:MAG TPA: DUF2332 domain-containing protein [Microlunatus sp.]|nr:DUF2332 domain-containing protein [Microlunatus sp.]
MVGFDRGQTLAERFRVHAGEQTHLYGYVLRGMADDLDAGGPTREVVRGYEEAPPGAVIQLRLLAGIFRLVLAGRAPELRPYYACLGGAEPPSTAWPLMRRVITDHLDELHEALAIAPQTNEVGRSVALLVGLFDLAAATGCRRVRLLELGASAGLNLLVDRFRVAGDGWSWGPEASPVQLLGAVHGAIVPADVQIVEALGCDLDPVDATSQQGRLRLTSFVWPFDVHRHERLAGALRLAAEQPPVVDRASAADWLASRLEIAPAEPDALVVIWHSVTQLYWPAAEVAAVRAALSAYGRDHRVAEVGMEYAPDGVAGEQPEVRTSLWSGDDSPPRRRLLGTAHDHGIPVQLGALRS